MRHWKRAREWIIVIFCLWHMAAVALFVITIPMGTFFGTAIAKGKSLTQPYVYSLSQWQYWNIFAPDPLQRSSTYRIDVLQSDNTWQSVRMIDYGSLTWFERAKEFKILENLEENWQVLVPSYLETFCDLLALKLRGECLD